MHYLRISIAGASGKQIAERVDGALRGAGLAACSRPDPTGIAFEVMGSDDDLDQLLQKLCGIEQTDPADLLMSCMPITVDVAIDPGSGPRTRHLGLVSCEECRALREPATLRTVLFQPTLL
jgi:hypothetical protein